MSEYIYSSKLFDLYQKNEDVILNIKSNECTNEMILKVFQEYTDKCIIDYAVLENCIINSNIKI